MSALPNANTSPWATKLFAELTAIYGSQKVAAMWADADIDLVKDRWEAALRKLPGEAIAKGLAFLAESGPTWPPTLPEFIGYCKDFRRNESQQVAKLLSAPGGGYTDTETAQAQVAQVSQALGAAKPNADPLYWAKHPKSASAVQLMLYAAETDDRFRSLIREHMQDLSRCRSEAARHAIVRINSRRPSWMADRQPGEEG